MNNLNTYRQKHSPLFYKLLEEIHKGNRKRDHRSGNRYALPKYRKGLKRFEINILLRQIAKWPKASRKQQRIEKHIYRKFLNHFGMSHIGRNPYVLYRWPMYEALETFDRLKNQRIDFNAMANEIREQAILKHNFIELRKRLRKSVLTNGSSWYREGMLYWIRRYEIDIRNAITPYDIIEISNELDGCERAHRVFLAADIHNEHKTSANARRELRAMGFIA